MGVRAPDSDALDLGRGGGMSLLLSVLLAGRANDEMLARELGRDASESKPPGFRLGSGPNESRLTPEVDSRGTCFAVVLEPKLLLLLLWFVGVVSSPSAATEDVVEPTVRFLDRIVTVDGTWDPPMTDDLGDDRGGVLTGAGSLERADCTLASSRCICAVRERM